MLKDVLYRFRLCRNNNELDFIDEIYNETFVLIKDKLFSISGKILNNLILHLL